MSVLREEEIVTMKVLSRQGESNCAIARRFGVTEGTVRYHLKRAAEGASDGRADKPYKAEELAHVIEAWYEERSEGCRPINVKELWEHLVEEYGYQGSYRSVLRFVRKRWGKPAQRTWRRVETAPGAQSQTDWGEFPRVELAEGPEDLSVFLMSLSHSRKPAMVWSRGKDQLSWIHCHNRAFERLAGIPAVNRIDNVKTAIVAGAGAWGTIHPVYRAYSRSVGFHIDACGPRQAQAKGKVEAKVRLARLRVDPTGRRFDSLEHLQEWSDERLERWTKRAICPATGLTVAESWEQELERLAPLPILPEPFDVVVSREVHRDCTVSFEGRSYAVPFRHAGRQVEVRGCAGKVQILADHRVIQEYPRHTPERILIDASCYEGESTEEVKAPPPLGRMGRRLQEIYEMPAESRPLDLYAALAEVAR